MNIAKAFTILILLSGVMQAQLPEAPHKFWDKQTKIMFGVDMAAKAYDGYMTHTGLASRTVPEHCFINQAGGESCRFAHKEWGIEADPIARPFVKTTAGQVAYFSASVAADAGIAYLFHKTGHHKLERWAFRIGAVQSAGCASAWFAGKGN